MAAISIRKYNTSLEVYEQTGDNSMFYVGQTADIKAMFKSIARNKTTDLVPLFCDAPIFSDAKQVYALCIDNDGYVNIINSDTFLAMILAGDVESI